MFLAGGGVCIKLYIPSQETSLYAKQKQLFLPFFFAVFLHLSMLGQRRNTFFLKADNSNRYFRHKFAFFCFCFLFFLHEFIFPSLSENIPQLWSINGPKFVLCFGASPTPLSSCSGTLATGFLSNSINYIWIETI